MYNLTEIICKKIEWWNCRPETKEYVTDGEDKGAFIHLYVYIYIKIDKYTYMCTYIYISTSIYAQNMISHDTTSRILNSFSKHTHNIYI